MLVRQPSSEGDRSGIVLLLGPTAANLPPSTNLPPAARVILPPVSTMPSRAAGPTRLKPPGPNRRTSLRFVLGNIAGSEPTKRATERGRIRTKVAGECLFRIVRSPRSRRQRGPFKMGIEQGNRMARASFVPANPLPPALRAPDNLKKIAYPQLEDSQWACILNSTL